jgi:predicted pyridoxine 5'-phosphate oxidase superfamily flavin-nucleotide-binding protein
MQTRPFYHAGMIALQESAAGRPIETHIRHDTFTEDDKALIGAAGFFFIATSFGDMPDCSFKGGDPGFVKVTGPRTLEFPDYDGNLMFRTLGNITKNPNVALLFIDFGPSPKRLRLHGTAVIHRAPERLSTHEGAKAVIEVECLDLFPNCPRYIPDLAADAASIYNPRPGTTSPVPEWKALPQVTPLLPESDTHPARILADRDATKDS